MPKPSCEPACPDSIYEVMLECWRSEEVQRPTFEHLSVSEVKNLVKGQEVA